jgi:hypothetical protein
MSGPDSEQRVSDLERRLDELVKAQRSRRWFQEPAWWGVVIASIAVLASLYAPVWKPLFSNDDHTVVLSNTMVSVTRQYGVLWLDLYATVSNPTSSVVYLARVQADTSYTISEGRHKGGKGTAETFLCPVIEGTHDAIPAHDSLQYSVRYQLEGARIEGLHTTIVVRPAYGAQQTSGALVPSRMTAVTPIRFQFRCPDGTLNNGSTPAPSEGFRSRTSSSEG